MQYDVSKQYVRLDCTTPLEVVWDLLEKQWNLEPPKLIISVIGGAKRLMMKPRLMSTLKRGLINTLTAAGENTPLHRHTVENIQLTQFMTLS
jgi:SLOG in TRPM